MTEGAAGTPAVEIVTIGDELLLGYTIDTNGAWLARELAAIGLSVSRRTAVGDDATEIASAVRGALRRATIVITTGGLGPTADDMTKASIAALFGRELVVDQPHVEWMRERWRTKFGREMPESNIQQAMIPRGATKLVNNHGSAPGIWLEDDGRIVCMLPGVPREMRGMTEDTVIPMLEGRHTATTVVRSLTVRTTGVAESLLGDRLRTLPLEDGLTLAYLPSVEGTDLRLTVRNRQPDVADAMLSRAAEAIRQVVGDAVYGQDDDDLAAQVLVACRARGARIAVAESCTGGLLGARLTAVPGSSDVVIGGLIAYDNRVKIEGAGVPPELIERHGAVSEEVATAMATGTRARFGASHALAITGVAGPGGGTPAKPVGMVWVALADEQGAAARCFSMIGDRDEVRRRSAQGALDMLRHRLR